MARSWRLNLNIIDIHKAESIPNECSNNQGYKSGGKFCKFGRITILFHANFIKRQIYTQIFNKKKRILKISKKYGKGSIPGFPP